MTGTNPGAWPDQPPKWAEDLEEMPERLFTTADLKAARLETVDRVALVIVRGPWIHGQESWNEFRAVINNLKEEIENEG